MFIPTPSPLSIKIITILAFPETKKDGKPHQGENGKFTIVGLKPKPYKCSLYEMLNDNYKIESRNEDGVLLLNSNKNYAERERRRWGNIRWYL